ncbi:hypothetical protein Tco_1299549 [Tanacetum coccineum]
MAKAQSEHLWLTQYMVSEQNLGSNEKGTKVRILAEANEEGNPRANRILHVQDIRRVQKPIKGQNEGSHAVQFLLKQSNRQQQVSILQML